MTGSTVPLGYAYYADAPAYALATTAYHHPIPQQQWQQPPPHPHHNHHYAAYQPRNMSPPLPSKPRGHMPNNQPPHYHPHQQPQHQPPQQQLLPPGLQPSFTGTPSLPPALQRHLLALDKKASRERQYAATTTSPPRQQQKYPSPLLSSSSSLDWTYNSPPPAAATTVPPAIKRETSASSPSSSTAPAPQATTSPLVVIGDDSSSNTATFTRSLPLTKEDCSMCFPRAATNWCLKVDQTTHKGYLCIPLVETNNTPHRVLAIQVYPSLPGVMAALDVSEELVAFLGMVSTVVDLTKMGEKAKNAMLGPATAATTTPTMTTA